MKGYHEEERFNWLSIGLIGRIRTKLATSQKKLQLTRRYHRRQNVPRMEWVISGDGFV